LRVLIYFCLNKDADKRPTVKNLLADIKVRPKKLVEAIQDSEVKKALEYIHQGGIDFDQADQDMFTMLHEASANGLEQVVDGLCSKGATTEVRNKNGEAPLHLASYKGFTKVVKVLLAKGADKHALDNAKWTALHFAAAGGHLDVVNELLTNQVEINAKEESGKTPLDFARFRQHEAKRPPKTYD